MEGNWRCAKNSEKMEDYLSGIRRLESPSVAGLEGGRAVSAAKRGSGLMRRTEGVRCGRKMQMGWREAPG
jgi:hypothetical protein